MNRFFLIIISSLFTCHLAFSQLTAVAGTNTTTCLNYSVALGGTPSVIGGVAPFKYLWEPSTFLNSTSIANPVASNITSDITYTLTVTDYDTTIAISTVNINIDKIYTFSAGLDTGFCFSQEAGTTIGADINNNTFHAFTWQPAAGLDNANAPRPFASPTITTVYTLTVSDGICPDNISQVTISAFQPPFIDASPDTTIDEGQTITLKATGAVKHWWSPDYNMKYRSTPNPDVWPINTTVYTYYTEDQHGCYAYDNVTVTVIPGDHLFFYSAFTPNGDGENDVFYIGNVEKFPDNNLKIYNRYGKLIFSATNYTNTWDGKYLGSDVPTGTYFYIFDDGKEKKYNGSVTIIR